METRRGWEQAKRSVESKGSSAFQKPACMLDLHASSLLSPSPALSPCLSVSTRWVSHVPGTVLSMGHQEMN